MALNSWAFRRAKEGWICSSSCFVFHDSQKQLWCVLISVTAGQWTGLRITDVFLLAYATIFMCACAHACVSDSKWGEDPTEPAETEQTTSSHYPLGRLSLTWALLHVPHCPDTRWDSRVIYLHSRMKIHAQHTHTHAHAVCIPGGILKSFSANLRESLAPMLINVGRLGSQWREEIKRTQTENWGTVWGTKEILRGGDYENPSMKIYMT